MLEQFDRFDRTRRKFIAQFESDGDGFLYRRSAKSAPIHVSAEERERFIDGYDLRKRYLFFGAGVGLLALFVVISVHYRPSPQTNRIWLGSMAALFAVFAALNYWSFDAPMRELRRR